MSFISSALGTKVAIVALSLVALGGGAAVAASTGSLPGELGSDTVADSQPAEATTDEPSEAPTEDPADGILPDTDPVTPETALKGPDATGQAAYGLCTAYAAGGLNSRSVAYASLRSASESTESIAAYCAPVVAAHDDKNQKPNSSSTPAPEDGDSGEADSDSSNRTGTGTGNGNGNGKSDEDHGKGSPRSPKN